MSATDNTDDNSTDNEQYDAANDVDYQGRVRTKRGDMKSKAARYLFMDFMDWRISGFMPWIDPGSVEHWKSRDIFQEVAYGDFKCQARKLSLLALSQLPDEELPNYVIELKKKNSIRGW